MHLQELLSYPPRPSLTSRTILVDSLLGSFLSLYRCLGAHAHAQTSLIQYCSRRLDSALHHHRSGEQDDVAAANTALATEQNLAFLGDLFHHTTVELLTTPSIAVLGEVTATSATDSQDFIKVYSVFSYCVALFVICSSTVIGRRLC